MLLAAAFRGDEAAVRAAVFVSFLVDLLAVALFVVALVIVVSGGTELQIAGLLIRARTVRNPVSALSLLVVLRSFLIRRTPWFLGIRRLDLRNLPALARRATATSADTPAAQHRARLVTVVLIVSVFALALANAWIHFGFFSGDDVEIQEMSLSRLLGYPWHAWNLRNPFYPLAFVFPVQAAVHALGANDPAVLVFSARAMVAAFTALTIWLVYIAARKESGSAVLGASAAAFLACNRLAVAFASTELPRPVAAAFVVGSYLILIGRGSLVRPVAAGLVLGVGGALRFSEFVFTVPATLVLLLEGRKRDAIVLPLVVAFSGLAILGIADALYWKQPFYSAWNIVDYTLIDRLSSRGYQPLLTYLTTWFRWTDPITLGLALVGIRRAPRLGLWFIVPLVLLSCLPHKEERYLIPLMPFQAMLAALGLFDALRWIASPLPRHQQWRTPVATMLAGGLVVAFALEAEGFRFRRSESAVEAARYCARIPGRVTIAVQDTFRAGGTIYFGGRAGLMEIDPLELRASPDRVIDELQRSQPDFVALAQADAENHLIVLAKLGFEEIDFGGRADYDRYRLFGRWKPARVP